MTWHVIFQVICKKIILIDLVFSIFLIYLFASNVSPPCHNLVMSLLLSCVFLAGLTSLSFLVENFV